MIGWAGQLVVQRAVDSTAVHDERREPSWTRTSPAHHAWLLMRGRLTDEQRAELLRELGVGQTPSPEQVRADIEQEWLLPSKDGRKELAAAEWTM